MEHTQLFHMLKILVWLDTLHSMVYCICCYLLQTFPVHPNPFLLALEVNYINLALNTYSCLIIYKAGSLEEDSFSGVHISTDGNNNHTNHVTKLFYYHCVEFEPLFAKITESRYARKFTFVQNLTQESALINHMSDNLEGRDMVESGEISVINPCSFDFIFHGIRKSKNNNT